MKPITRKEQFIHAAAEGTTPPKPLTREELILSGADVTPLTREEYFAEMQSGGGGETKTAKLKMTTTQNGILVSAPLYLPDDGIYTGLALLINDQIAEIVTTGTSDHPTQVYIEKKSNMYCNLISGSASVTSDDYYFIVLVWGDCNIEVDYNAS